MINPTSLSLREIFPTKSYPAELKGWELVFLGAGGMASVIETKDKSLHGVCHEITRREMEMLDKIEGSYMRLLVDVETYEGKTVPAFVYQMDQSRMDGRVQSLPPSERYIDIIVRGGKHFGMKKEFLDWLLSVTVVPRRLPKDYRKLNEPADPNTFMTIDEVKRCDGLEDRDLCTVINGKVLKFVGDLSLKAVHGSHEYARRNFGGRDATCMMARNLYEPLFPIATTLENMSIEHRCFVEDMFAGFNQTGNWKAIAYLDDQIYNKQREILAKRDSSSSSLLSSISSSSSS
jgi:gamma-glutamylcyclotransferase (GGCT)/AIG2-like uncharacterized protein YtfP